MLPLSSGRCGVFPGDIRQSVAFLSLGTARIRQFKEVPQILRETTFSECDLLIPIIGSTNVTYRADDPLGRG